MADNDKTLTTAECSQATGLPVSTITRMLRLYKLRGRKRGGKWAIYESEIKKITDMTRKDRGERSVSRDLLFNPQAAAPNAYPVETFVQMTYLTEKGVRQWLKSGRLSAITNADGDILVDAANLNRPEFQHLLRR